MTEADARGGTSTDEVDERISLRALVARSLLCAPLLCAGCGSRSRGTGMLLLEILVIAAVVIGWSYYESTQLPPLHEPSIREVRERRAAREAQATEAAAKRLQSSGPDDVRRVAVDLIRRAARFSGKQPPFGVGTRFTWGCVEQRAAIADGASRVPRRNGGDTVRVNEIVWAEDAPTCSAVVVRAIVETPGADPAEARVELWHLHRSTGGSWQLGVGIEAADHVGFSSASVPGDGVFGFEGVPCLHEVRDAAFAAFLRFVRASRNRELAPLEGLASIALVRSVGDAWRRQEGRAVRAPFTCRVGNVEVVGAELRGDIWSAVVEVSWQAVWERGDGRPSAERSYVTLERSISGRGRWTLAHFSWDGDEVVAAVLERALDAARTRPGAPSAVLAWAVAVAVADGRVSGRERLGILQMATAAGVTAEDATNLMTASVAAARRGGGRRSNTVPVAPAGDARAWLRGAVLIAIDGGLTKPELAVLTRLGASMGMTTRDVRRFVDEVVSETLVAARDRPPGAARA